MLSPERFEALKNQLQQKKQGLEPAKFEVLRNSLRQKKEATKLSQGETGVKGFAKGVGKGILSTLFGIGKLGTKLGRALLPKVAEPKEPTIFEREKPAVLEPTTKAEKIGFGVEQIAEFAIPATKVTKVAAGANFLTRLGGRILSSAGVATGQAGEVGTETGIAAGTEAILPVANKIIFKPVFNIVRRLFKGLGSGLSGVSTDAIDTIVDNPKVALQVSKQIESSGNFKVLEDNARAIVNGIANVRKQARKAFGEGLEKLKAIDIDPQAFRGGMREFLTKFGITFNTKTKKYILGDVEFSDKANVNKASELLKEGINVKLDGFSLRKLLTRVGDAKYKIATTDERLAFNAFINNLESGIKTAINKSTDKLKDVNKAFSTDIQLAEGMERIFGKIKFKSLKEIDAVAKKLESLFAQTGLDPRDIDRFLTRIGIDPAEFRTSEAVRQITARGTGLNRPGLTFAELTQQLTSAIITPETVKNISIATGLAEQIVGPLFEKLAPTARVTLIKFLIDNQK